MFITPAFAQAGQSGGGGALFTSFIMPLLIVVLIMYFLVIRPQQRKQRELRDMISGLKRGDTVVTSGGIIGKITKVIDDDELQVEIADGVRIKVVRATITEVPVKSEPRKSAKSREPAKKS